MESKFFKLNLKDFGKGILVCILSAGVASLASVFNENGLHLSLVEGEIILKVMISSALAYIIKNLFTDSSGEVMGSADDGNVGSY